MKTRTRCEDEKYRMKTTWDEKRNLQSQDSTTILNTRITTFYYRAHKRQYMRNKIQDQQYFVSKKEKILVTFLLLMFDLEQFVRVKNISSLTFNLVRQRFIVTTNDLIKSLNKNWSRVFEKRNLELKARRVKAINWKHHENNIYVKITHWFEVIEKVIQDSTILRENDNSQVSSKYQSSNKFSFKIKIDFWLIWTKKLKFVDRSN